MNAVTMPMSTSATAKAKAPSHIIVGGQSAKSTFHGTLSAKPM